MNKKNFILIAIVLVMAGIYAIYFTDWFRPKTIQISHTSRPARTGARTGAVANPMIFGLGDYYSLTEIKVIPLAALQTDKLAQPVWHLVSDSGSDDVDNFFYGQKINGMDPAVEGARPEPLQPGVTYRLFVAAGKARGQHDFHIGVAPANTATNR
jgi:hypothetical protein